MRNYWLRTISMLIISILLMGVVFSGCVESTPSSPDTPTAPQSVKKIVINYSSTTQSQIGEWNKADSGYTYLIIDMNIENQGYATFSTNSFYFSVVIDNIEYSVAWVTTENELKAVDLLNGGRIRGTIAFEVPEIVSSVGYQIRYSAFTGYDIEWNKQ